MTVKAGDDDEYLPINDFYTYNAYKYWELYGLTADTSRSYTDTYSSSGGLSFGATFTMQSAIQETFEGDTFGSFQMEYEEAGHNYSVWIPKSVDLSITPDSGQTGAQTVPSFACTYDAASTSHSATMNCTPSGNSVFTQDDYTMTINTLGDAGDGTGGLFCYIRQSSTNPAVGSITATEESPIISHFILQGTQNGYGNFSGTGSVSFTTTTVNTNSLDFTLPVMTGTIDNTFDQNEMTNRVKNFMKALPNSRDNPITFLFLTSTLPDYNRSNWVEMYGVVNKSGNSWSKKYNATFKNGVWRSVGGYFLQGFSIYTEELPQWSDPLGQFRLVWKESGYAQYGTNKSFVPLIPLYVGGFNDIPDDLYRFAYGKDRQIEAIDAQTAADQQHHDQMMDTSDSNKIATDGDALVNDADEKFGDLFFPLQHAIETANDLSNVQSTGTVRLPAIFADGEYWILDLTQIEQNIPQAFSFIRSLCQLAVAIFMIKGLYNLFFGNNGGDDNDS